MNRFFTLLMCLFVCSIVLFAEEPEGAMSNDKYDIFYKNGKIGGSLEKLNPQEIDLQKIFSVDLRKDENFLKAIDNSIIFYTNVSDSGVTFRYGDQEYTPVEMINSLQKFKSLINEDMEYQKFLERLSAMFDVYEAKNNKQKAILTGYYTPHFDGTLKKTKLYKYPVLVGSNNSAKPLYFVKSAKDLYSLKLEGAGVIELADGSTVTIEYAGKKRVGKIKKVVKTTSKKIKYAKAGEKNKKGTKIAYSRRIVKVSAVSPYFRITNGGPFGWADVPLTPKYTAAIDRDLAPMGGLMYIKSTQNLENVDSVLTSHPEFNAFEGFMLAQDIGSAIKGGGRVDIYCGDSPIARHDANSISRVGTVYLIVAKKEIIDDKIDRRAQLQ